MPGSVAAMSIGGSSVRSRSAYRTIGRTADVDETLFGGANHSAARAHTKGKEVSIVGKDTVQVRKKFDRASSVGAPKQDAVIIPASELNRLRDNARLLTKEEELEQKRRQEELYTERMQKSRDRKERIRQMGEERKKKRDARRFGEGWPRSAQQCSGAGETDAG